MLLKIYAGYGRILMQETDQITTLRPTRDKALTIFGFIGVLLTLLVNGINSLKLENFSYPIFPKITFGLAIYSLLICALLEFVIVMDAKIITQQVNVPEKIQDAANIFLISGLTLISITSICILTNSLLWGFIFFFLTTVTFFAIISMTKKKK